MLKGIDVSSWQTIESVDEAPDFVIVKATQGVGYVSPTCDAQYQRAKQQGKLLGVYHYASGNDPIAEANFFVDNIKGYIKEAILVLDWESNQNPRFNEHAGWCQKFLDHVYSRTGVRPLIYMSASVLGYANWSNIAKDYGLWLAGYPDLRDSWKEPDFIYSTAPWDGCAIWQYTNSNGRLDRNFAYMTKEAWKKYANPSAKNESPKKEAPKKTEEPKKEETPKKSEEPKSEEKVEVCPANKSLTPEEYSEIIKKAQQSVDLVENKAKEIGLSVPMSSKTYDVLKIVVAIVLPSLSALYIGLSQIWGFGLGEQVDQTIQLLISVINAVLGIAIVKSSSDFHKGE